VSIAFTCVLIAALLPYISVGLAKSGGNLDNNNPRDWATKLEGFRKRAHAAHNNAFEAFPFFAISVLIASQSGKAPALLDTLSISFIAARLIYLVLYLADFATLRSLAWVVGIALTISIFTLPLWAS
jgi:uncharacterized MAPEG superfamily protein